MVVDCCIVVIKLFFYCKIMIVNKVKVLLLGVIVVFLFVVFFFILKFGSFVRSLSGFFCILNWFLKNVFDCVFCVFYVVFGGLFVIVVLFCNIIVIWELFRNRKWWVLVMNMIFFGV